MTDKDLKMRLFERGAMAVSQFSAHRDLYACPLCRRLFSADALAAGILTLEHVPPESQGGRGIALTCKECNNTAGYTIDAALHRRDKHIALMEALAGKESNYKGPVQVQIGDVTTNGELRFTGREFVVEVSSRHNSPVSFQSQTAGPPPATIRVEAEVASNDDWSSATVSDLKSAYMAAFAMFGYSYCFHPRLDDVRRQIQSPNERTILKPHWIAPSEFPEGPVILGLTSPFAGLLVRMGKGIIGLPWVEDETDFYAELPTVFADPPREFQAIDLGWPTTLEMSRDFR